MLIKGEEKYITTLSNLWHEVFGDSEDYIKLFFSEAYSECECFAEIIEDTAVSALYLLDCDLRFGGSTYKGRYLYAAATLNAYRSKGIMSKLIEQAKAYCANEDIDFIALVPAGESLYGYYEKFGFESAMYKYRCVLEKGCETGHSFVKTKTPFHTLRERCKDSMLIFSCGVNGYAEKAMRFSGAEFFENDRGAYFVAEKDFSEIYEFLPLCEQDSKELLSIAKKGSVVYTPCECEFSAKSEKIKNGMIYFISDELKDNISGDIYMNIALD